MELPNSHGTSHNSLSFMALLPSFTSSYLLSPSLSSIKPSHLMSSFPSHLLCPLFFWVSPCSALGSLFLQHPPHSAPPVSLTLSYSACLFICFLLPNLFPLTFWEAGYAFQMVAILYIVNYWEMMKRIQNGIGSFCLCSEVLMEIQQHRFGFFKTKVKVLSSLHILVHLGWVRMCMPALHNN